MEITATNIVLDGARCLIEFESKCGAGRAVWVGVPPPEGAVRHVEVQIRARLLLGKDLIECEDERGIRVVADGIELVGDLIDWSPNSTARIDFGCGVVDVELESATPPGRARYRLRVHELELYDCNY